MDIADRYSSRIDGTISGGFIQARQAATQFQVPRGTAGGSSTSGTSASNTPTRKRGLVGGGAAVLPGCAAKNDRIYEMPGWQESDRCTDHSAGRTSPPGTTRGCPWRRAVKTGPQGAGDPADLYGHSRRRAQFPVRCARKRTEHVVGYGRPLRLPWCALGGVGLRLRSGRQVVRCRITVPLAYARATGFH